MSKQGLPANRQQAGFTLVELAIVMIIIGLLIGGVLKGQELINNAQITSTVAQVKGIDAASTSFRDMFNGLPGDLRNAATRLNGCTAADSPACFAASGSATAGDGNIATAPGAAPGVESQGYFVELALADLLTGVIPSTAVASCNAWGGCYPEANVDGGFMIGYTAGNAVLTNSSAPAANTHAGHYLTLTGAPDAAMPALGVLTPNQAARIDAKIDDNNPGTGVVLAAGTAAGAAGCASAATASAVYNEALTADLCNLYIRVQN